MSVREAATGGTGNRRDHPVGYLANHLAAITAAIHLILAPPVLGFSRTLAILFALNGLGFAGGIALYITGTWRRELYLVATVYALVTFVAFLTFGGFDGVVSAFYTQGGLNYNAVAVKTAEVLLAGCGVYLDCRILTGEASILTPDDSPVPSRR